MDELRDLIFVVNKRRISQIEIFDKSLLNNKANYLNRFYLGLVDNKYNTDEDAANDLYGCSKSDIRYRQLKSRLKKRLLNTLFFLNINSDKNLSKSDKNYYECINRVALINILMKYNGINKTIYKLIIEVYDTAKKEYILEALVEFAYRLSLYYLFNNDKRRSKIEFENYQKYYNDLILTREATIIYYNLSEYDTNKKTNINTKKLVKDIARLKDIYNQYSVVHTYFCYTWAKLIYADINSKYNSLLNICDEYIENNDKLKGNKQLFFAMVLIYKSKTLLHLHRLNEVLDLSVKLERKVSGNNWFILKELEFSASIKLMDISISRIIIDNVKKHPKYKSISQTAKEKWLIYEAYLIFFENISANEKSVFRYQKLINTIKNLYNEKIGFNISLRILEFLLLILRKDYNLYQDKIYSLLSYSRRYLRGKIYTRERYFINFLHKIAVYNFNPQTLIKSKEYQLIQDKQYYTYTIHEYEIMYYDKLINLILEHIKK